MSMCLAEDEKLYGGEEIRQIDIFQTVHSAHLIHTDGQRNSVVITKLNHFDLILEHAITCEFCSNKL